MPVRRVSPPSGGEHLFGELGGQAGPVIGDAQKDNPLGGLSTHGDPSGRVAESVLQDRGQESLEDGRIDADSETRRNIEEDRDLRALFAESLAEGGDDGPRRAAT